MLNIFGDGFYKTLIVVTIAGILVSSLIALAASVAVDKYFNQVISGIIGDAGEYDVIVHIRSEMEEAGSKELKRVMNKEYPGSNVEEGVKLAGNSNYLLSLPEGQVNAGALNRLPGVLKGIPGSNGYTIILEPRITLRSTNSRVNSHILEEMNDIEGVSFAYINRGNVEVVLESERNVANVTKEINELLSSMQVVEIRFDESLASNGEQLSVKNAFENKLGHYLIKDASSSSISSEQDMLIRGLVQMRSLLELFTTQAKMNINPDLPVQVGDTIFFPDEGIELLVTRREESLIAGRVIEGDGVLIDGAPGYYYCPSGELTWLGQAQITSNRAHTINRIDDFVNTLEQLEDPLSNQELLELTQSLDSNFVLLLDTFRSIQGSEIPMMNWLKAVQGQGIDDQFLSEEVQYFKSLLKDIESYFEQVGDDSGISSTEWFEANMEDLRKGLLALSDKGEEGRQKALEEIEVFVNNLNNITDISDDIKHSLEIAEGDNSIFHELNNEIEKSLENITSSSGLKYLADIGEQARQISMFLPQLSDKDINALIKRIDIMLEGQNHENSLVFITETMEKDEIKNVILGELNDLEPSVFLSPAAVVDSSIRSILFNIIRDTRGIIAALLSLVFTICILLTDHSIILSTYKGINRVKAQKGSLFYPHIYGIITGSVIHGAIFTLSGASIPYINIFHMLLIGAILGLISNLFCEKISPVNDGELEAGLSLGLTMIQILEDVIVPAGRPGILFYLVSRKRNMEQRNMERLINRSFKMKDFEVNNGKGIWNEGVEQ